MRAGLNVYFRKIKYYTNYQWPILFCEYCFLKPFEEKHQNCHSKETLNKLTQPMAMYFPYNLNFTLLFHFCLWKEEPNYPTVTGLMLPLALRKVGWGGLPPHFLS